jgi:hypothetical protein
VNNIIAIMISLAMMLLGLGEYYRNQIVIKIAKRSLERRDTLENMKLYLMMR